MAAAQSAPAVEQKVKPTKPNEDAYKADLALAEKEHAAIKEKLVCVFSMNCLLFNDGFVIIISIFLPIAFSLHSLFLPHFLPLDQFLTTS